MTAASDLARTARTRQVGLASALFVAPWFIVAANTADTVMTFHGGDDLTPSHALAVAAAHPSLEPWANAAAMLGSILLVPAILGVMRVVRAGAAWLGLVGGVLMAAGYICYFGLVFQGQIVDEMVKVGGSASQNIAILQASMDDHMTIWVPLVFVVGNVVGTFLLGLALVRSNTTPRWAGVGLMTWSVLHIFGIPGFEIVGAVAQAIGLAAVGIMVLREPTPHPEPGDATPYELLRK
jgi:hypothetical protein